MATSGEPGLSLDIVPVGAHARSEVVAARREGLRPAQLRARFDEALPAFETTAAVEELHGTFGHARAAEAIALATAMAADGYNLFVMGPPGSGKRTMVMQTLAERAASMPAPDDWAYVNNFESPASPLALRLPAGDAPKLKRDLEQLVEELRTAIPAVFESDEYRSRESQLGTEFSERHEKAFAALAEEAAAQKVAIVRTPAGFSVAPLKDSEVMSPEEYAALPEPDQERIRKVIEGLQGKIEQMVRKMIDWRREWRERMKALNREMTLFAVGHHVGDLKQRYAALPRVVGHLEAVERDVIENADMFRAQAAQQPGSPPQAEPSFSRYSVNVAVQHDAQAGAPVVDADHPTHANLLGRIDHVSQFGALVTDFTLIRPGALHRANGGCIVIDARKLLLQPFAWEAVKRALTSGEIRIESPIESYGFTSTVSLTPEAIPLALKVVLIGDRQLYYLLSDFDPDFAQLFKVVADFEDAFDATPENLGGYVRLVATIAKRKALLPFDRSGVTRVIEEAVRAAGDARKVDARIEVTADLMSEADHRARTAGHAQVTAADVEAAAAGRRMRLSRMHERLHEAIMRGTLMIDTSGAAVGQVNALSVYQLGELAFGEPTRITATTRLGDGEVIDVQREVKLGGAIHSKGVMILSAFLASRFSQTRPHSLTASLVFEQTYGLVEGDSASTAELCALLSSLADVPIKQSLALTGSVNQLGEVQAIGGVNEKIEGFFDVCAARGLTGEQGVIIPQANVENLMLRPDVVEAVRNGRFAVYAVRCADDAMELLTGLPAGVSGHAGTYPESSVNGRVAHRLRDLAEARMSLAASRTGATTRAAGS